jgi:hypothetical protein
MNILKIFKKNKIKTNENYTYKSEESGFTRRKE